jgi:hypothetical protein
MDAQATGCRCAPTQPVHGGFLRFFADLPDPRAANAVHRLSDILLIAVCAVICGAEGWVDVETFGNAKLPWLSTFLELPRGIPSHDTFGRVFARLDPDAFERCFGAWVASLRRQGVRLLALDGKSIRRSFAHAWDHSGMAHLVSAFAAEHRLAFAQVAAEGKGRELEALRRLLDLLALPILGYVFELGYLKSLIVTPKTAKELRADDKANQSRIRRELRVLPSEHDQTTHRST